MINTDIDLDIDKMSGAEYMQRIKSNYKVLCKLLAMRYILHHTYNMADLDIMYSGGEPCIAALKPGR